MYKVFIYDKPVYLTSDADFRVKNCQQFTRVNVDKVISALESEQNMGVVICCANLESSFNEFIESFTHIKAAGGVVENVKNELLFNRLFLFLISLSQFILLTKSRDKIFCASR